MKYLLVFSRTNNEQRDWLLTDMRIGNSLERATVWLLSQRNEAFHWGRLATTHALLALSRSGYNISTPELKLAIKEMDINFLHDRLKYRCLLNICHQVTINNDDDTFSYIL